MKIATAHLKSVSPYSQNRKHNAPNINDKESASDKEARTWRERLHVNKDGYIFIPPMVFKKTLEEAAQFLSQRIPGKGKATYTKHFAAGVLCTEPLVLPIRKEDAKENWLSLPSNGKRGSGGRVDKCIPVIEEWEGKVDFLILDETITKDIFTSTLIDAGRFIGIGNFRPINRGYFGRFEVIKVDWKEGR